MKKDLSEMSLKELWELFPIILKEHKDELYFRDYLTDHPDVAVQYGNLKLKLWKEYEHNRDGYTEAKTEFIKRYTEKAKSEYADRYIPK